MHIHRLIAPANGWPLPGCVCCACGSLNDLVASVTTKNEWLKLEGRGTIQMIVVGVLLPVRKSYFYCLAITEPLHSTTVSMLRRNAVTVP